MLGYGFEIIYIKGKQIVVVDALSRKEYDTKGLLCVVSIVQFDWAKESRIEWNHDEKACRIIQKLQKYPSSLDKFVGKSDSRWYQGHLYLSKNSQLK